MSLDTVLNIGKEFKNSSNSLKYFKYVQPCPKDKKGNYPLCLSIKVNDDYSIDFNNVSIVPENQREKLYYLTFKTSDRDSYVKYIYGDIYYEHYANIEKSEGGYYRLANPNHPLKAYQCSSFDRGNADFNSISEKNKELHEIREGIKKNIVAIEKILRYSSAVEYYFENKSVIPFSEYLSDTKKLFDITLENNYKKISKQVLKKYDINEFPKENINIREKLFNLTDCKIFIHFNYNNKHWYDFKDCFDTISLKMFEEFVDKDEDGKYIFKKALYKNLCSGDSNSDIQFPQFKIKNRNKSKVFSEDEVNYLFYGKDYSDRGKSISKDLKLIVLPLGENLTEEDYLQFVEKRNEQSIVVSNEYSNSLFDFAFDESCKITVFDLIFTKKGGKSPDSDLVEISGIEKSKLRHTNERISRIAHSIYKERSEEIKSTKELLPLSIEFSFLNILGNPQYDDKTKNFKIVNSKKYQSHLLKVLPLIYLDNYINDNILLTSFIQNTESSIRSGDCKYTFLKYDLKFLLEIQNNKKSNYMEIVNSESYMLGQKLGELAKPLGRKINSFQKNYVGMLTRRASSREDCIMLVNDIIEKLVLHDCSYQTNLCGNVLKGIANLQTFDKEIFAFGFFEGYFKYTANDSVEKFVERVEKLLSDFSKTEEVQMTSSTIREAIENLKEATDNLKKE